MTTCLWMEHFIYTEPPKKDVTSINMGGGSCAWPVTQNKLTLLDSSCSAPLYNVDGGISSTSCCVQTISHLWLFEYSYSDCISLAAVTVQTRIFCTDPFDFQVEDCGAGWCRLGHSRFKFVPNLPKYRQCMATLRVGPSCQ